MRKMMSLVYGARTTAEERSQGKERSAEKEHPAVPPYVAEFSEKEEQSREDQQVHDDGSGGKPGARVEIACHLLERDRDAAGRKGANQGAKADEGEVEPPVPFRGGCPGPGFHTHKSRPAGAYDGFNGP